MTLEPSAQSSFFRQGQQGQMPSHGRRAFVERSYRGIERTAITWLKNESYQRRVTALSASPAWIGGIMLMGTASVRSCADWRRT